MTLELEPIIIAAIAAGSTAVLALVITASILLHNRLRRRSRHSHLPPNSKSTSAGTIISRSSTQKSHPHHLATPPPSSVSSDQLRTPASSRSKLRKLERSPDGSYGHPQLQLTTPAPASAALVTSSPIPSSSRETNRLSTASSIMLLTYDQGLARLGLSSIPPTPPLPTGMTVTTVMSSPSNAYTPSTAMMTTASFGLTPRSPYTDNRAAVNRRHPEEALSDSPHGTQIDSEETSQRRGQARYLAEVSPNGSERSPALTSSPQSAYVPTEVDPRWVTERRELYGRSGLGEEDDSGLERRASGSPVGPFGLDVFLPSYYQPGTDSDCGLAVPPTPIAGGRSSTSTGARTQWGDRI